MKRNSFIFIALFGVRWKGLHPLTIGYLWMRL